jgi:hypothetical protein
MARDLNDLANFIDRLNYRVQNLDYVALNLIGSNALQEIQSNFNDSGLHSNDGFKPWKESEAARRRQAKGRVGDTTLLDTHTLYKSIKYEVNKSEKNVKVGLHLANAPYAVFHNEGKTRDGIRRQFIYLSNKVKEKTIKQMDEYLSINQ